MLLRSHLLIASIAALATVSACRRREPPPDPNESARRAIEPSEHDAGATGPPLRFAPAGSPVVSARMLDVVVYTPAPFPAKVAERAKLLVRTRMPDIPLVTEPKSVPASLVKVLDRADLTPPTEDQLAYFGRGLSPEEVRAASASKGALLLSWSLDADPKLQRLRKAQELALDVARESGGFVWDEITREMFTVDAWRERRIDGWQGDLPNAGSHFATHYYAKEDGRHRAVTVGLVKLGLPDLVVQDAPKPQSKQVSWTINAIAQLLSEGAAIGPGGTLVVDFRVIRHDKVRADVMADPVGDPPRRATVELVVAQREEGDADNRLMEVRFGSFPGATEVERQSQAMAALFGAAEDMIRRPGDDPELAAVKQRVQARLPAVAAAFRKGLPVQDHVMVKAPFDTDSGGVEWMWISVTGWEGDVLRGNLDNSPYDIKSLEAGAKVEVKQSAVADYRWQKSDGTAEGGESVAILRRRDGKK